MARVDAHQHFWDPATAHYPWMSDAVAPLCRRFGPDDLEPLLRENGIDCSIVVQARSDVAETREFMAFAADNDFVAGAVGWVDLTDPAVGDVLDELQAGPNGSKLVGVRHQVEDEPDADWLVRDDVQRGLKAVAQRGLVYDLLLRPPNLPAAVKAVRALPEARFVVDHIAKPLIKAGELEPWESLLREVAASPNVWCKLSGLITEADRENWKTADLVPYVERVVDMFGTERLLFGSDWPVVLLAGSYKDAVDSTLEALPALSPAELDAVMGGNAIALYRPEGLS